jgi:AcrR family transcriptional regulator
MARKPQQNRAKVMVESIVEAGFISLAKHGLEHTTTRHIADIAGVSVGSVYEYFANKEMIYAAMHRHFMAEVMAMLHELTPLLIQKSVREAVELMLYRFSELLKKDEGRYLPYMRYMGHFDHSKNTTKIEQVLMDIIMKYVMNNPHLLKAAEHIPRFSYIIINAGIFSIIRHLSTPSPLISFEELLTGLGDMVESYVDAKLLNPA